jgi:NADH-quinone oxidoreductase subunit J
MVLFLFVVMLMNLNSDTEPQKNLLVQFAGVLSGGILLLVLVATVKSTLSGLETTQVDLKNMSDIGLIKTLGKTLFSEYVFPFEIASVLFLSAIVGAVVLSKNDSSLHTTNDVA